MPVASKNTKKGDMPAVRITPAFKSREPLVAEQFAPAGMPIGAFSGRLIVTVVESSTLPPGPEHLSEKVAFAASEPVLCMPLTGTGPAHAPEALHSVAPADDQTSVVIPPLGTLPRFELIVTVGRIAGATLVPSPEPGTSPDAPHPDKAEAIAHMNDKPELPAKTSSGLRRHERNDAII